MKSLRLWVSEPLPTLNDIVFLILITSLFKIFFVWFCLIRCEAPSFNKMLCRVSDCGNTAKYKQSAVFYFVTFVKSNAKALLTLRIKSPLRSAEGTTRNLLANPVLVFAHIFTNTAYCARSQHAFMWTISSLARIFPYATSIEFLVATASATSFLSSTFMYLWGQLSYIRWYCRRVFRVVISHFGSLWAEVNLAPRWHEAREKTKKTRTFTYRLRIETPKSERHLFA